MQRTRKKKSITPSGGEYRPEDMAQLLIRSDILLTSHQLEQLWIYHTLLRQHNAQLNLTRIHNFTSMVQKLYVDSILPGRLIDLPESLMDLGTGPGMPGIPLKIAYPHLQLVLAETRGKRVEFLKMVIERLALDKVTVIGRSITSDYDTPVSGVITRAVEDISTTLDRISGCLDQGGQAIFMKGPECEAEVTAAIEKFDSRFRLWRRIDYQIPHTSHARKLIVFERIDEPVRERRARAMNRLACHSIESLQNPVFKDLKKLLSGRGIKKQEMALVYGSKLVAEVLRDFPGQCRAWITAGHHAPPPAHTPSHVSWYQLADPLFKTIDTIGTDAPVLLVETPAIRPWAIEEGLPSGCSVLIPFQDPENVGTVVRSAVAFGVDNIILLSESAHPFHPKAIRASGGAVLRANFFEGPSLNDIPGTLPVMALSGEGTDIATVKFPPTFAFLPGIEGQGLPLHLRGGSVAIPINRAVESLNAATAAAIAFYVWAGKTQEVTG